MKVGRPKKQGRLYRYDVTFSLREGEHDDLIAFFEGLPETNRVQGIINALRDGNAIKDPKETEEQRKQRIANNVMNNIL